MADSSSAPAVAASAEAQSRAKILEGVDFIETEEDAEAVESAVVKIQSTFRGKKIRSKLTQKPAATSESEGHAAADSNQQEDKGSSGTAASKAAEASTKAGANEIATNKSSKTPNRQADQEEELNNKVATMQVNDNSGAASANKDSAAGSNQQAANLPEEEAERAATKIQAGFKGYRTRKELESKLGGGQQQPAAGGGGQADASLVKTGD